MSGLFKSLVITSMLGSAALFGGQASSVMAAEPSLEDYASPKDPPNFTTPEEAVEAFKAAVTANNFPKVAELLGLDVTKAEGSDGVMDTFAAIREGVAKKVVVREVDGAKVILIGQRLWPFPFPVSKEDDGKWSFDTYAGLQEILARRIGENELQTIQTAHDYVDAQFNYAQDDHDGDGVLEYAQKLISTEGMQDGLYWPPEQGDEESDSPGGAALDEAQFARAKAGEGYFGYHYRILTSQGANIAGGQFDYLINGNLIAGFALVAWPVKYGETGIHTFVVNKEGIVYQADLGEETDKVARDIKRFNPGDKWEIAD